MVSFSQAALSHISLSLTTPEEGNKKERKRKDLSGKLGKEMSDRRDE